MRKGELPPIADGCPKLTYCQEAQATPRCPISKTETKLYPERNPLELAENLCVRALEQHSPRPCRDPYKRACRGIDSNLDLALASTPFASQEQLNSLIKPVLDGLSELDNESPHIRGRQSYYIHARTIEAFLPAFRDRLNGEAVSAESASIVHANLCNTLASFGATYFNSKPKPNREDVNRIKAARTELETMALLTRLGAGPYFPYPALEREEASIGRSEHNHDLYCIDESGRKIPIQVKSSNNSGGYKGVIIVNHFDIMRAIRETLKHDDYPVTKIPNISDLLLREQRSGQRAEQETLNYLNLATVYVISRIDAFNDFRRD